MTPIIQIAIVIGVFLLGIAVSRYTNADAKRRALPPRLRTAVGLVSLGGVWLLYFLNVLPSLLVDDSVLALTLSITLWVGLPLALAPFVKTDSPSPPTC